MVALGARECRNMSNRDGFVAAGIVVQSAKFKVVHGLPASERGVVAGDSGEQRIVCSRGFCSGSDFREFGTVGYEGWTFDGYPLSRKGFGLIGEPLHFFMPFVDRLH